MSKDNAKNNYFSTNYAKILIKRKKRKKGKKKRLYANGFKGLEKTFTNNGVYGLEKLSRNHSLFSLISSWKNKFRFKRFRFKSKV
jgi:hypothetical protein